MKIRMDDATEETLHLRDGLTAFALLFCAIVTWMVL